MVSQTETSVTNTSFHQPLFLGFTVKKETNNNAIENIYGSLRDEIRLCNFSACYVLQYIFKVIPVDHKLKEFV
ncbi:MAG: hypothetical protein Aureis2KO_03910 [Aureisphaera sp.]